MIWNPLYEVTALIMISLFLVFYHIQRRLPTRKNRLFSAMMMVEMVCIISDLIASWISSYYQKYTNFSLQFWNTVYFLSIISVYYLFHVYCNYLVQETTGKYKRIFWPSHIPMWILFTLMLSNPFTKLFFSVDNQTGYNREILHPYFLTPTLLFFNFISLIIVIKNFKKLSRKSRNSLLFYIFITTAGAVAQGYFFPFVLLVNTSLTCGMAVLFLSSQNPVYDANMKTHVFTDTAFDRFVSEEINLRRKIKYVGFSFQNYKGIVAVYGQDNVNNFLLDVGRFLEINFHHIPFFYMHMGRFICVLKEREDEAALINKITETFSLPWKIGSDDVIVKTHLVSMGQNEYIDNGTKVMFVMNYALDEVHENTKGKVISVDKKLVGEVRNFHKIRRILHETISKDDLHVFYQPIFDNQEGKVTSAEALVRIIDPELGIISPDIFIPLAEEDETILYLGMQVFRKVCRFIKEHDMDALGLKYIEVNLSPVQCMYKGLAEDLIKTACEFNVDLSYINFEITESSMINLMDVADVMSTLIMAGASFSLDDYGTGFSNLINVLGLPLKIIKIDKSIVKGYFEAKKNVLPKIINMFIDEQFDVLAEGVETEIMQQGVSEMGCRYTQGFHYSKPLAEDDFLAYLIAMKS